MSEKKKALIIDDDSMIRDVVSLLLEERGWDTVEGCDGDEVVDLALAESPDLVVLDVMMSNKSGFEALKELREDDNTTHIPVLMLTAVNDFELGNQHDAESIGYDLGVSPPEAFLEKPIDKDKIDEAINNLPEV